MGSVRVLLAVAVVAVHSEPLFGRTYMNGDMAINCFYMISGFLMTLILSSGRYPSLRSFYLNRALRIYPAFYTAAAMALVIFTWAAIAAPGVLKYQPIGAIANYVEVGNLAVLAYAAVTNFTIFGTEVFKHLYTRPDSSGFIIGGIGDNAVPNARNLGSSLFLVPQAWTLAIELQFYLAAPFLVRLRTPVIAGLTLVLTTGDGAVNNVLTQTLNLRLDGSAFLVFQIHYFLMGILAYRLWLVMKDLEQSAWRTRFMHRSLVSLAFATVFFGWSLSRANVISATLVYPVFMMTIPSLFYFSSRWKWDRNVGELSYPIYVFHFTFAMLLHPAAFGWTAERNWGEFTLLVTVVASLMYIVTIDRWVQAIRSRIVRRQHDTARPARVVAAPATLVTERAG